MLSTQITTLIHRLPPYVVEPLLKDPIREQDIFESAKSFPGQESGIPGPDHPAARAGDCD